MAIKLNGNGKDHEVDVPAEMRPFSGFCGAKQLALKLQGERKCNQGHMQETKLTVLSTQLR